MVFKGALISYAQTKTKEHKDHYFQLETSMRVSPMSNIMFFSIVSHFLYYQTKPCFNAAYRLPKQNLFSGTIKMDGSKHPVT